MTRRISIFVYGLACYAIFFATFLYSIAFIGGFAVPRTLDVGPEASPGWAVAVNLAILTLFAIQHSGMARRGFKTWWTRIVPEATERPTYVLASSVSLWLLFAFWQPLPGVVWDVASPLGAGFLFAVYGFGWVLLLYATALVDHFELFGVSQAIRGLKGRVPAGQRFVTPGLYRLVRHPIYLAWAVIFWATPVMTVGHLLFAAVCTAYMLVAIPLEERDLIHEFGDAYRDYRGRVAMLLPIPKAWRPGAVRATTARAA
jgi:protein-S-isoprenylcysteine O-methyltransferase Ste14